MKSAHTVTDAAVAPALFIVMLPIGTPVGIRNRLLPLVRGTDCPPIVTDAVTPVGNVMYMYRLPAPSGVYDTFTVDELVVATDTVCGEANMFEPLNTGNDKPRYYYILAR